MPTQNGGQGSCFLPKTDKQVSHSDSDGLTPGSSVRRVINVAYLLGTELCVFSECPPSPPPQKKMSTFQNKNIHFFFSLGLTITATFIFFLPEEGEISYERGCVARKALDVPPFAFTLSHLGIRGAAKKKTWLNCHDNLLALLQIIVWWWQGEKIPLLWMWSWTFLICLFHVILLNIQRNSVQWLWKGSGTNGSSWAHPGARSRFTKDRHNDLWKGVFAHSLDIRSFCTNSLPSFFFYLSNEKTATSLINVVQAFS